jgi:hypothetical protein
LRASSEYITHSATTFGSNRIVIVII